MCITQKSEVALEILTYMSEHTDAQDTLEGIVEWWLLEQKIRWQMQAVKEALAELVERGLIVERQSKDRRTHYRVNRRKMRAIRSLLGQRPGP